MSPAAKKDSSVVGVPRYPDVGVIAVVPEPWGGVWMSRHQILTRLSRWFHVVWVNPAIGWRELWFGGGVGSGYRADRTPPPSTGFAVCRQHILLPKFYRFGFLDRFTARQHLHRSLAELTRRGCTRIILHIWQPKFAESLQLVDHDVSCYHIVDEYSFSAIEKPVSDHEHRLIKSVDQVIVHSPALLEKKGNINPNTALINNGVNFASFARNHPEPPDLGGVPRPRVGYIGRIKGQLDWDILTGLAERRPEWSFVFVGPMGSKGAMTGSETAQRSLFSRDNVHYLGQKDVGEIPAYTQHMDVCLLCYRIDDYTRYIFPLKLHEYLAAGRPVVGSDIRTLRDFGNVVRIASDIDDWERSVDDALSPDYASADRIAERREVARQYDWDILVDRIGAVFCGHLDIDVTL